MVEQQHLPDVITQTLSPDKDQRRAAEAALQQQERSHDFIVVLLELVANGSAPTHVRQAAAVYTKNYVGRLYGGDDWQNGLKDSMEKVKSVLVDIMLSVPVPIRRQLSQTLATIADHEYPNHWPDLVPSLSKKLVTICEAPSKAPPGTQLVTAIDWTTLQGTLETLNAIFNRYPEQMRSDQLYTEINYSLSNTQEQVLALFTLLNQVIAQDLGSNQPPVIDLVLNCTSELCKMFFSLSWQDLPAFFEENMESFMKEIRQLLVFESPAIDQLSEGEPGNLDHAHASVLDIANIYASKYDEEFRKFVSQFVSDAWALLMRRSSSSKYDIVVTTGIKFLTTVARSPDYRLFEQVSVLSEICNRIVIPNIELRDEDLELFEDDPREYVRRDLEGSDTGTRRRSAVELVKGLCVNFEKPVTEILTAYVRGMLAPQVDWRKRDSAIFLVIALGWKSGTAQAGATETSSIIDVVDFFRTFVLPELTAASKDPIQLSSPIFVADLIKFVISFRNQIPKEGYAEVIINCGKLLSSSERVVKTYSAACIERILSVKDEVITANGNAQKRAPPRVHRINQTDIKPILPSLLPVIISSFHDEGRPNEYVMRLALRLGSVARDDMGPYLDSVLSSLVDVFTAATVNPANPLFNHFLFETFAVLIRFNATATNVSTFESVLVSPLCNVLINDVTEFAPYVFQVMSQLLNCHDGEVPDHFVSLMGPLLTPSSWDRRGYIPSMVLYIQTYIEKNSARVLKENQLQAILGVFQKLIATKATDHLGLQLLTTVFESFDLPALSPFITPIMNSLMVRLSKAKTPKYVRSLLCCLSTFVLKFGVASTKSAFDSVDPQVFGMLLQQVWLPEVVSLTIPSQRVLCSLALSELCDGEMFTVEPFTSMWHRMVETDVALIEGIIVDQEESDTPTDEDEDAAMQTFATESYSAAHSQLRWGLTKLNGSPLTTGRNPRRVLFENVTGFVKRQGPAFVNIFQNRLNKEVQKSLQGYGVTQ